MIRYVLKYPLDPVHGGQHAIPAGGYLLDLQLQNGKPTMWWSVPKSQVPEPSDMSAEAVAMRRATPLRTFSIAPTGPPGYSVGLYYVGTFQLGGFVGHVMSWEPVPTVAEVQQ